MAQRWAGSGIMDHPDASRQALIASHLDFARHLASERRGRGVSDDDLDQEAAVGLCHAADCYDAGRGDFAPHAAWWVRKYLSAALDAALIVTVPVRLERAVRKAHRARAVLEQGGGHPTVAAVAAAAGLDEVLCGEALRIEPSATPVHAFGVLDPIDGPGDELADHLYDAVSLCDRLERAVLVATFGLDGTAPRTIAAVARDLGLSRTRVAEALGQGLGIVGREFRARGWSPATWQGAVECAV